MCGLAGYFGDAARTGVSSAILKAMCDAIRHRGPDAEDQWVNEDGTCGLGHRRLAIIDLSEAGIQPMHSHDGRWTTVYNGEIYNYETLRRQIDSEGKPVRWRGHSDTEVLLEYISRHELKKALQAVDGMFAIALYDHKERKLHLARDAFGEKPLYYANWSGTLLFGSELKALRAFPGFAPEIRAQSVADFFKYSYVPGPATIHEGVFKLPAAHMVAFTMDDVRQGRMPEPECWWDMPAAALDAKGNPFGGTFDEAVDMLDRLLGESAARRMVSDVPLGSLLSGGIDSSIVTALMQEASTQPVRTFSIGMDEEGYNEAEHAKAVAAHLGTDHTELILTPREVQETIPHIASVYDEPFSDSSQVPTFLVSQMARRDVTVVESGDGGDEVFGGYNRYFHGPRIWNRIGGLPEPVRNGAGRLLANLPMGMVQTLVRAAGPLAPEELRSGRAAEKLQKLARAMQSADETAWHDRLLATSDDTGEVLNGDLKASVLAKRAVWPGLPLAERAMLTDTGNYMCDDVLVKVDRASMAVALEVRTPFLNRELFEFAWSLPMEMRAGGGQGKRILRELLYRKVPRAIVDRPKAGFAVPVGRWMRTELRDWVEESLSPGKLGDAGIFNTGAVRKRWQEHLSGRRDHESFLWSVLMYQGWLRAADHGKA